MKTILAALSAILVMTAMPAEAFSAERGSRRDVVVAQYYEEQDGGRRGDREPRRGDDAQRGGDSRRGQDARRGGDERRGQDARRGDDGDRRDGDYRRDRRGSRADDVLSERRLVRRLMRNGFVDIEDVDLRRDRYIVRAIRRNGAVVRLAVDAYSGEIIARERIGWARDGGWRGHRRGW